MMTWYTYEDDRIKVDVPSTFRLARGRKPATGVALKGRLVPSQAKSTLELSIDCDLSPDWSDSYVKYLLLKAKQPGGTDPDDLDRYVGVSLTRPGGGEERGTLSSHLGEAHRWTIVFPIRNRWVYFDLSSTYGGPEWAEFEEVGTRIIKSLDLIDNPGSTRGRRETKGDRVNAPSEPPTERSGGRIKAKRFKKLPEPVQYLQPVVDSLAKLPADDLNEDIDPTELESALRSRLHGLDAEAALEAVQKDRAILEEWLTTAPQHHPAYWVHGYLVYLALAPSLGRLLEREP